MSIEKNKYLIITDSDYSESVETLEDVRKNLAEKDEEGEDLSDIKVFEIVRELKVKKEFRLI